MELIKVNYDDNTVSARDVYEFVFEGQVKKTAFNVWISRAIKKYDFREGKDFQSFSIESTGGRPKVDYVVTTDMGKELAMVASTEQGKIARKYFLKCEEIAKNKAITRAIGKEARRTLTDSLKDSGENERMHNQGIATYTTMAYEITGLKSRFMQYKKDFPKRSDFRDTLDVEELRRVEIIESMAKSLIDAGKQYTEIKDTLKPIFKTKERNTVKEKKA